jgi:DNA-binding NtrC family response regulator/tetratricopeptide (TPR) repeat protein
MPMPGGPNHSASLPAAGAGRPSPAVPETANGFRYTILRKLGSGGAGSVYLARDLLHDGQKVALKVFRQEIAAEEILREFRILRQLRHLGIARAFDFGRLAASGQTYLAMEYVAGPNLEKESVRLRREARAGCLGPFVDVFLQLTGALGYLHEKGLLHLDLKPSNVVFAGGRTKLIDFGLFQNLRLEDVGRARGTAHYTAPEVFTGGPVDARADLYSLGVTLYRALTGKHPITGRSLAEIAGHHQRTVPPPPAGVPEELSRIVLKLLAKSPRHRFQSACDVEKALRALNPETARPAAAMALAEPDFAGRRGEMDAFFTWLDGLGGPEGSRTLIVEGEPGIGKSRFLDACATEMIALGVQVIPLPAGAAGRDGLRALIEKWCALHRLSRRDRSRYRFLLTAAGIGSPRASRTEIEQLDLEKIRARVFQEAVHLFAASPGKQAVIVIDDLDRRDGQLLDFVRRFTRSELPRQLRLGVLASARAGSGREVDGALRIVCGALGREDTRKCLEPLLFAIGSRTAAHVQKACRGNPGILLELTRQAIHGGEIDRSRSPGDLPAIRRARERGLDEPGRTLLLYLNLLAGRPARETLLRDLSGLSRVEFQGAKTALHKAGLLRVDPRGGLLGPDLFDGEGPGEFAPETLRRAHERIGLRLRRSRDHQREAAVHLLRGGRIDEGLTLVREGGRRLRGAGRVEEALQLYQEALSFAPAAGEDAAHFLEELGDLREKSGQFDEAGRSYDCLLHDFDLTPAIRLRVLRKRGGIHQRSGQNEAARTVFAEALELLEKVEDLEEHLYLLNELAAFHLFRGDFSRSMTFANRGLEILRSEAARRLRPEARALHDLNLRSVAGHILLRQFEYDRAADEFQRSLKLSERIGTLANTALILNNLGVTYYQSNRLREALAVYRRAASLARRMGDETALFSIQCNVAGIRARLGELRAAEEILAGVEKMPHTRDSQRARLFLLHTRGLVGKLTLEDSRPVWEESIRIASELPDPLLAAYGRLYLGENEILQGRWGAAREILESLDADAAGEPRLRRSLAARRAYLEALTGHETAAAALLSEMHLSGEPGEAAGRDPAEPWNQVLLGCTLIELGRFADAGAWLGRARASFRLLRQPPGMLESALLLADLALRRRDAPGAEKQLKEARRALSLHDTSRGSRASAVRIPYLEARAAMQSGSTSRTHVSDRLFDAAGNLPAGARWETSWLLHLAGEEHGEAGARERAAAARALFMNALAPADRKSYLARDHRARLGLGRLAAGAPAGGGTPSHAEEYFQVLSRLCRAESPKQALELIAGAAGVRSGAVFVAEGDRTLAAIGPAGARGASGAKLRRAALALGSGAIAGGSCAEIRAPGRPRLGVLYVEGPARQGETFQDFLETAARLLADWIPAAPAVPPRPLRDSTPFPIEDAERTRTVVATSFVESESPRMRELLTMIRRTGDSRLPVLLTGESGTGKDLLARWIHALSPCRDRPFLSLDCSAIPEGLIAAELFGYEAGSFTGADRSHEGCLVAARGGTVYLDNVDSVGLETQAKLLRVLEDEEIRALGSGTPVKIQVRFIASSQRDLRELASRGEFRGDFYYRLSGICLVVPPLREHVEDIPLLIRHFQRQLSCDRLEFSPAALAVLRNYSWPGNVRELESLVRRLALTCEGKVEPPAILHALGIKDAPAAFPRWIFEGRTYQQALRDVKREYLLRLYELHQGDIDRIACELRTTRRNVYQRFLQAGVRARDLRGGPPEGPGKD